MRWRYYHTVWLILVFGWITNYMVRASIGPLLIPIMEEFHIGYAEAGLVGTAFFITYTLMQLPAGYIGDRIGRKMVLASGAFWWAASSFLTGISGSFSQLFAFRFLTGIGEGVYFGNDRPIIAAYTPKEKMGFGQGISFTGLGVGMMLGTMLAGVISDFLGWRYAFYFFALPSLVAGVFIITGIKEPPKDIGGAGGSSSPPNPAPSYRSIFLSRDLWLLNVGGISAVYALWVVATWAPTMLKELGVAQLSTASIIAGVLGGAAVPGLLLSGHISDLMYKRGWGRKFLVSLELLALALFLALLGNSLAPGSSALVVGVLIFMTGLFVWGVWAPIYALISDIVPLRILGTAFGLANSVMFIGSLLAPWLTGLVREGMGSFAWGSYIAAMLAVLGALLIMAIEPVFRVGSEKRLGV